MSSSRNEILSTLRTILRIWRQQSDKPVRQTAWFRYLFDQYRKYQVTQNQLCKSKDEIQHLAKTYSVYLSSGRQLKALHEQYHAKGERSVEDTARLVGLTTHEKPDRR